ncbi:MAG: FeoB-associated Cys-rich membrane protein [Clostridia bacterium]|nr:FeoB-associated Cys-rich membrane protein [Clostridia bacterium]
MVSWISANLVNIALIAAIVLIVGMLIRVMVRDRRAGKAPCGGNCASCGACRGCDGCSRCGVTPSGGDDCRRNMNQL